MTETDQTARREINHLPCVFARALVAKAAVCELARGRAVGARQTTVCASPVARSACGTLYGLLREKAAFPLHLTETRRVLPLAQVMKIQCGGLNGLKQAVSPQAHAADVHLLVRAATVRYGSLDGLPFSEIVKGMAAWQGRTREH